MTAVLLLTRMTTRQVLGVRRFIGLSALAVLPGVLLALTTGQSGGPANEEVFVGVVTGFLFSLVIPVVALILAGSALGDERRDETLPFVVLRPLSRLGIATAKLGGALVGAVVIAGVGALVVGGVMTLRTGDWGNVVPVVVGAGVATVAYCGVFAPLGFLTERATLIGLAFVFIWEGAVAGVVPALAATSPWRIGFSAFAGLAAPDTVAAIPEFALGNVLPGAGGAVLKALVVFVLGVLVTRWILLHRDLV